MRIVLFRLTALFCLAACLAVVPMGASGPGSSGVAWAQDDDDGGGDDDDDDDGGITAQSGRDDNSAAPPRRVTRKVVAPRRQAPVRPQPEFVPEIVVLGLAADDLTILLQEGFVVLEARSLVSLDADLIRLQPPADLELPSARERIRLLASGANADFNHLYRTTEDAIPASSAVGSQHEPRRNCSHANCAAHDLVEWPEKTWREQHCPMIVPQIGIIDTGVNTDHDLIENGNLEVIRLNPDRTDPSSAVHGTAIVSVFAGKPDTRVEGLLPEGRYVVVDVFTNVKGDERADAFSLVRGLDLLASRQIRIVNLSLSGPENATLASGIADLLDQRDMIFLAAVGNSGPDKDVAFPAAYDGVIGVTAIDRRGRIYRSAQRGAEVDLAAPGSGLLLATSVSGAKEKTGTSFAVPFATAAAALALAADPTLSGDAVQAMLTGTARDLGEAGQDHVFGHGVLQAAMLCP